MSDFGKIAIGLRYTKPSTVFMESWTRLISEGMRQGDKVLPIVGDLPHHFAAETLVYHFLKTDCDTLLMVDDDHGFQPDTLHRLRNTVANHSFDVVGALYPTRRPPYRPIIMVYDPESDEYKTLSVQNPRETEEVHIIGLGMTLIRRDIILKIKKAKPGELLFYWPSCGDGEDASFCRSVREQNGKIGVDTRVCITHDFHGVMFVSEKSPEISMTGEVNMAFTQLVVQLKKEKRELIKAAKEKEDKK